MPVAVPDHLRRLVAAALIGHLRALVAAHHDRGGPAPDLADLVGLVRALRAATSVDGTPTVTSPDPSWLTTAEAARRLNITARRVRQLAAAGKLAGFRLGRTWAILEDDCGPHRTGPAAGRRR